MTTKLLASSSVINPTVIQGVSPSSCKMTNIDRSSVARGAIASPIGLSTKTQNRENTTFLALLRLLFVLEWTKKWFKTSFEAYIQGGEFVKNKSHKSMKTLKNAQK